MTFEEEIRRNKRVTTLLVLLITLLLVVAGGVFALSVGGAHPDDAKFLLPFGGAVGGVLALIGVAFTWYLGAPLLALVSDGVKQQPFEDPLLHNCVEEMSIAAGLPRPKVYVIQDQAPNAFASGRDPKHAMVAVTTGLRNKLTRDELQAVIAHEMAHIKNYDTRLMLFIAVFAGIIVLAADFFSRFLLDITKNRMIDEDTSRFRQGPWVLIFIAIGIVLSLIAPIFAKLLQLAVSREREYLADATAVQLCRNPLALASALEKIAMDQEELACDNRATEALFIVNPNPKRKFHNANFDSVWATHPPLIKRISRLRKIAGEMGLKV